VENSRYSARIFILARSPFDMYGPLSSCFPVPLECSFSESRRASAQYLLSGGPSLQGASHALPVVGLFRLMAISFCWTVPRAGAAPKYRRAYNLPKATPHASSHNCTPRKDRFPRTLAGYLRLLSLANRRKISRYSQTKVTIRPNAPYHSMYFGAPA
jgi:hypothetical protein